MKSAFFLMLPASLGLVLMAACSSSDGTASPAGNTNAGTGSTTGSGDSGTGASRDSGGTSTSAALTCSSRTLCTSYTYSVFGGYKPADPVGGQVKDGLYRTIYGTTTTAGSPSTSPIDAVLFSGKQYLFVGFGQSETGTYTTSGSMITFTPTQHCNSYTGESSDPAKPYSSTFTIDSAGNFITYYDGTGNTPPDTQTTVYGPVNALCSFPDTPATTAGGDSANCSVTNCGCAENTDGPADSATCKLVSGG